MTPVVVLTDTFIANAAEPWRLPDVGSLEPFPVAFHADAEGFQPYQRDPETLARRWVKPGTPGLEHRIGGLEKDYTTGNVSYDPENHQRMTDVRHEKIARIADDIPEQEVDQGPDHGAIAVVGWGSTYGPISRAVERSRRSTASTSRTSTCGTSTRCRAISATCSRATRGCWYPR